jgi:DNA-binding transcriptional ArsR family regulator
VNESDGKDALERLGDRARALDRLLEHRTRLGACVLLAQGGSLAFAQLRLLLDETDGNLGAHLRKLEDAGYIAADKQFVDRKPVTRYALTRAGTKALEQHLAGLQALLGAVPGPVAPSSGDA